MLTKRVPYLAVTAGVLCSLVAASVPAVASAAGSGADATVDSSPSAAQSEWGTYDFAFHRSTSGAETVELSTLPAGGPGHLVAYPGDTFTHTIHLPVGVNVIEIPKGHQSADWTVTWKVLPQANGSTWVEGQQTARNHVDKNYSRETYEIGVERTSAMANENTMSVNYIGRNGADWKSAPIAGPTNTTVRGVHNTKLTKSADALDVSWTSLASGRETVKAKKGDTLRYEVTKNNSGYQFDVPANTSSPTWRGTWTKESANKLVFEEVALQDIDTTYGVESYKVRLVGDTSEFQDNITVKYLPQHGYSSSNSSQTVQHRIDLTPPPPPAERWDSQILEVNNGNFNGQARLETKWDGNVLSSRVAAYKFTRKNGQSGGNKANLDFHVVGYHRDKTDYSLWKNSPDNLRQDGEWHDLDTGILTQPWWGNSERIDVELEFTFDKSGGDPQSYDKRVFWK